MMTASLDDIRAVTENVFASLTEFTVVPVAVETIDRAGKRYVTAAVHITGEWEGTVAVACDDDLAREITGVFFGVEPTEADDGEINDAIGEVANMIGGNVKALMPAPSQLSLPTVTTRSSVRRPRPLSDFHCSSRATKAIPRRSPLSIYTHVRRTRSASQERSGSTVVETWCKVRIQANSVSQSKRT